ncbi:MAG: response regulator [Gammaproteobacteria bacterium]|nr:response regulator [Gammaproteobacteria bacterium]MBU1624601.1 response regulator [Gammaproteobacteria bacterium]MBU1982445.1 response regulator [Gammaproteobacteria bacterium]
MTSKTIMIVDDEAGIRELLSEILYDEGYGVLLAENAEEARKIIGQKPDVVLLDIWMPDTDGLTLLKEWVAQGRLTMPVIMMSGHGTIETALEATRIGAVDFLEKPIALKKLLAAIAQTLKPQQVAPVKHEEEAESTIDSRDGYVKLELPLELPFREAREHFDTAYLNYHLEMAQGNIASLADKIGIERTHLYRKLKQLGIKPPKKNAN